MDYRPVILIVDDELEEFYPPVVQHLKTEYNFSLVRSKKEMRKVLSSSLPVLALVDINIDETHDGFEVLEHLNDTLPYLPVIVVTNEDIGKTAIRAIEKPNVRKVLIKSEYKLAGWCDDIRRNSQKKKVWVIHEQYGGRNSPLTDWIFKSLDGYYILNGKLPTSSGKDISKGIRESDIVLLLQQKANRRLESEFSTAYNTDKSVVTVWVDENNYWPGNNFHDAPSPVADFSMALRAIQGRQENFKLLPVVLNQKWKEIDFSREIEMFETELKAVKSALDRITGT